MLIIKINQFLTMNMMATHIYNNNTNIQSIWDTTDGTIPIAKISKANIYNITSHSIEIQETIFKIRIRKTLNTKIKQSRMNRF